MLDFESFNLILRT